LLIVPFEALVNTGLGTLDGILSIKPVIMKKVLIAFDGTQFSEGAFEFARNLNTRQPILLVGAFIPQVSYANLWSYAGAMAGPSFVPLLETEDTEIVQKNIARFEDLCQKNGIACKVHKDFHDFALPELKRETRFADLLIISSEKFYENLAGEDPSEYMKDALHASECPVVVVPERFDFPSRNILAYDGSDSSVFAIKQFAYLFPELSANETMLVFSNDKESKLPYEHYIEELASQHFNDLSILKLDIHPRREFHNWICENRNAILVSGSYGRSFFSQIMRKSFVSEIIAEHRLPVFTTHR
jgi:nucleotide-binding universal stress UspA family protein